MMSHPFVAAAMRLMKLQPFVGRQAALASFCIVAIHLAQRLQYIATFVGKVLRYFHELSPSVGKTIRQQNLHPLRQLHHIARERVTHLNDRARLAGPVLQHLGEVLAGMLTSGEVQRNLPALRYKAGNFHKKVKINPVEGVRSSSKSKYKAIRLTPAQTLTVLKQLMNNPLHFTLVFTVAATGVRSSEVVSLRWSDIDWDGRFIRIEKARKKSGVDGDPKTGSSERDVGMGRVLTHYLTEWRKQTPYGKEDDFVFPSLKMRGNVPISSSAFDNDHLRPAARNAGAKIPDRHRFGLHNLRHSLSNWLVNKAKENPKTVQGILGHSRIQTTLDLYTDSERLRIATWTPWEFDVGKIVGRFSRRLSR
jgi:integrase